MGPFVLAPRLTLRLPCCGGAPQHRLEWQGSLARADGPLAEGERTLSALGGAEPLCSTLERVWEAVASASLRTTVFHLLLRNHAERLPPIRASDAPAPASLAAAFADVHDRRDVLVQLPAGHVLSSAARAALARDFQSVHEAESLFGHLPAPWRVALAAELLSRAATVEGWASLPGDDRLDVQRIVGQLAAAAVGPDVRVDVDPWHTGTLDGRGTVLLPATWFSHVWALGAASVDRCLVLHLTPTGPRTALARLRAPDGTRTRTVEVERSGGGWAAA